MRVTEYNLGKVAKQADSAFLNEQMTRARVDNCEEALKHFKEAIDATAEVVKRNDDDAKARTAAATEVLRRTIWGRLRWIFTGN